MKRHIWDSKSSHTRFINPGEKTKTLKNIYILYFLKVIPTVNFFMPRLRIKINDKYEKTNHELWNIQKSRHVWDTN